METHSTSTDNGVLGRAGVDRTSSSSTTTPATTLPTRNTGYGDFCFGRQDMHTLSKEVIAGPLGLSIRTFYTEDEGLRSGSSNILVREVDSFERCGHFPFFDLPLDIRRKIYRELVQPFFELDPDSNQDILNFTLKKQQNIYSAADFENGSEAHVAARTRSLGTGTDRTSSLRRQYWRNLTKFAYKESEQLFNYDSHIHPERNYPYKIQTPVRKLQMGPHIVGTDWLMIDLMRHLSNVSSKFRHEQTPASLWEKWNG
ncbi:hypothetical protein IFR05_004848 [Cadophora sp. M221]|nr:hypothetical protein IFR05_004848 [Cadophora sp. M221]